MSLPLASKTMEHDGYHDVFFFLTYKIIIVFGPNPTNYRQNIHTIAILYVNAYIKPIIIRVSDKTISGF